jgi:glycosyltransferase involved in cell wall biosynthesis
MPVDLQDSAMPLSTQSIEPPPIAALRATIVIPAHNEAAVIARTLHPLRALVRSQTVKLVVVANACSDNTAQIAAQSCPGAIVIATPIAGKTQALNLGLTEVARDLPVVFMDADLEVTPEAVLGLIGALDAGHLAAIGQMQVNVTGASAMVRAYQRAWAHNPYFAAGKFGGLFALAPRAVAQLFPLPDLLGDDEFLRRSIAPAEVAFVPGCTFVAQSPRTIASLFATRKRALRGARQLGRMGLAAPQAGGLRMMLRAYAKRPREWFDLAVFLGVAVALRLALAAETDRKSTHWERDLTTRCGPLTP